jgi:putrescine transport system substrate-binding protein
VDWRSETGVNVRTRTASILSWACLLLLATACGDNGAQVSPDIAGVRQAVAAAGSAKVVNVYNWFDYIDPAMIEKFTAETGIRVNYDTYDSNEVLETKLLAGRTGYDVVVPSLTFLERQIRAGVFRKLDRSKIPNWTNLDPEILRQVALVDPGNTHAVPYMWGTNGIGYNEGKLEAIMPDAPVDSWRLVFDPAIASRFKECGIAMLDSPSDVVPLVLIYLGKDANSESAEDLRLAERTLMAVRPYVRMIHSSALTDALANGELCVTVNWNGPVGMARERAAEAGLDHVIKYSIPKEGTVGWFDSLAVPKDAPHPDTAHIFINFMQRPDVAAANSNVIHYANGNARSYPLIDESVRTDPGVYPPAQVKSRLTVDIRDSEQYSRLLNRTWSRFVAGS